MPLTNAGALVTAKLYIGESVTNFATGNARLGVGDSSTAFAKTQTDLQAATNKLRVAVDAAPVRTGSSLHFTATFSTAQANFPWNEWGIFNAASAGDMLTRKVQSLGTKTSADAWQLVLDVAVGA